MTYKLLDSGNGFKWEQFGPYILQRPAAQAVWEAENRVKKVDAAFTREGEFRWEQSRLPKEWTIEVAGIQFLLSPTDFGHLGIFPEQKPHWGWIQETIAKAQRPISLLNLFAYSGGSTLAAAKAGASVCHLDASSGMVDWARKNAALNNLQEAPIRWIVDDVNKFLARELRRERRYDAIVLDPPSFGRGANGEVFKIETHLGPLLDQCRELLSDQPLFVLFSCHTPGYTPIAMTHLMTQKFGPHVEAGEMVLEGEGLSLPSGTFARWTP
jgi:23S rRNA (cytosine1962-C5)-methyltransferase